VGGILRDVVAMGARPIALLDGLRFGAPGFAFERAVAGIGHYGNCVGVPTVGGDTVFDDAYATNPLVNAMCVGVVPTQRVTRAGATRPGDAIVLFGATTGRDGIGGASVLASQELSDESEDKRPTVQIGDPFTGKKLIEASLEIVEAGLAHSLQDLGAAGLASALAETAGRGGVGIDLHLDAVPLREPDLEPVEIMLSESQERMVLTTDRLDEVAAICRKWELHHGVVGEVTESGELRAYHEGELVGAIPAALLTEEAPRYRVETRARTLEDPIAHRPMKPDADDLLDLLASPNVSSRASVYRRYDHLVGSRTVRRPGLDAAVLRLRPSLRGLAISLDGSGRAAYLDPRTGGANAVLEAARNVACAGGRPLALTDCLNFGNPEKAEIAWELAEAIDGMAAACEALRIPVVSGNVSLYNETDGRAIYPTPVVGCVGFVADVRAVPRSWRARDLVFAVGAPELRLDGSEYQARFLGGPAGRPPQPNLTLEANVVAFLWRAAPRLSLAHDAAEGGLAVALAEAALWSGVGARVELDDDALAWFGEGGGQAIVSLAADDAGVLDGVPHRQLGVVGGDDLLGIPLGDLRDAYGAL
jgi:phosphoribosylformylglycinamidine synthase II